MNQSSSQQENNKLGRYELLRPLGQGAMGVVYLANDPKLNRKVAIKCVEKKPNQTKLGKRLQVEATLLAQLNHPNIIQLYDVIENDHTLGLVIEYVEGASLVEKCRENSADRLTKLNWIIQIADGLEKAHQAGIAHCDLKLENVLINHKGEAKIADFGIAKAKLNDMLTDNGLTEFDKVSGSYFALSPEQATGQTIDYRTDLFSLGILIHLVLTGQHPFGNTKNHLVIVDRIVNRTFKVSSELEQSIGNEIAELINKLLEKKPENRPSSAQAVADYLRTLARQESGENLTADDLTVELSAISVRKTPLQKSWPWLGGLIVACGLTAVTYLTPSKKPDTLYVAVTTPTLNSSVSNKEQLKRIKTTIEHSIQEGLLNINNVSLVPSISLDKFGGDLSKLATASATDIIITATGDCSRYQCDIRLQRHDGTNGTITNQRSWPVLSDSLSDIRNTTVTELKQLFPNRKGKTLNSDNDPISEQAYEAYLKIYLSSAAGTIGSETDLDRLDDLINNEPNFLSLYSLYRNIAILLQESSEHKERYLTRLQNTLNRAPQTIEQTDTFKNILFSLLIARSKFEEAQQLITVIEQSSNDRVLINTMKANLAYANNDYQQGLAFDKKNAQLIPSVLNFYNLATSQIKSGELDSAQDSIQQALTLHPNDLESLNLSASIAAYKGNIDYAISTYERMIEINSNSDYLTNLSVALTLKGDYQQALKANLQAISLDPFDSAIILNLADSYHLIGNKNKATNYYQSVIENTQSLFDVKSYNTKAQAQAHLGLFNEAIKTLRLAQKKFPDNSDINYAATIVHTLSGNLEAALVEVEQAKKNGTDALWFSLPWFEPLCHYSTFRTFIKSDQHSLCLNKEKPN